MFLICIKYKKFEYFTNHTEIRVCPYPNPTYVLSLTNSLVKIYRSPVFSPNLFPPKRYTLLSSVNIADLSYAANIFTGIPSIGTLLGEQIFWLSYS